MKIRIGQVWYHTSEPTRLYRVTDLVPNGSGFAVKSDQIDENDKIVSPQIVLGYVKPDYTVNWSIGWQIRYPPNTFTRISPKFLRKRIRDQMASEVFAHRLTEETVKHKPTVDWRMVADYAINSSFRTDSLYLQQRLIDHLNYLFNTR